MMVYGWKHRAAAETFFGYIKKMLTFKDVVFCKKDLMPFMMQLFILSSSICQSIKYKLPIPAAFIHDLNWEKKED